MGSGASAAPVHPTPIAASRAQTTVKPRSTPKPKATIASPKPAPAKTPVAPAPVDAPASLDAPIEVDAPASAVIGDTIAAVEEKPMTESELVIMYQRIGHDIQMLQNDRGTDKVLDLWPTFRAIKLKEQCKTAVSRLDLQGTLEQLRAHIDRRRGITISAECLNNPLSADCR